MKFVIGCLLFAALTAAPAWVRAEVFQLVNGGRVEGELLNANESPRTKYVVRTPSGGEVTLTRAQVKEVVRRKPAEIEFERLQHEYADTVEGQWALSEWCRQNGLKEARQAVLERVIELEPDHSTARSLLGYNRVDGAWKTQQEILADRGLIKYKDRLMTPQEKQLIEEKEQRTVAESEWFGKLKNWRGWLDDRNKFEDARNKFLSLDDAAAVPALKQLLENEPEDPSTEAVKVLLVDSLAHIGSVSALKVLAHTSLVDPNDEVRLTCLDHLQKKPQHDVTALFVQKLRDKDNIVVNRAGKGLGRLQDPSAIPALIDALVTKHKFAIVSSSPGSMSAGFGSGGNGLSMGGGPQTFTQELTNPDVLDALVSLSGGMNFRFDVLAWKKWSATQRPGGPTSIRRD